MKRSPAIILAFIVFIGGGAWYYATQAPLTRGPAETGMDLPDSKYIELTDYADIAANYATSTPLVSVSTAANAAAINIMKQFVSGTIAQFKEDAGLTDMTPAKAAEIGVGPGRREKLNIVYLIASSPKTVSYIFTIYQDTLGAHGNTTFKTFAFDTSSGAQLTLADLFTPGASYLDTLSEKSRAQLYDSLPDYNDQSSRAMIDSGTTPEEKNFSNFFLDNGDFVILFPPYQVAPYSAGPQTLRIPLAQLADILKPAYLWSPASTRNTPVDGQPQKKGGV